MSRCRKRRPRARRAPVGTVIGQEWPEMAHGRIPAAAGLKAVQLRDVVAAEVEAATCRRRPRAVPRIISAGSRTRLDRLLCVSDGLIPAIWMLILVDTLTMLAFGALLRDRERRHAPIFSVLMALSISLIVLIIVTVDRPLYGRARIDPGVFHDVLRAQAVNLAGLAQRQD